MGDGKFFHSDGPDVNTAQSVGESLFVRVHKEGNSRIQEKAQYGSQIQRPQAEYPVLESIYGSPVLRWAFTQSPTLQQVINLDLPSTPWGQEIKMQFVRTHDFPDYDPRWKMVYVDTTSSDDNKIRDAAHELFHATHQGLEYQYNRPRPLLKRDWIIFKAELEARAFLQEVKVSQELRLKTPVTYAWVNGNHVAQTDVGQLVKGITDERQRIQTVANFLWNHDGAVAQGNGYKMVNGQLERNSYRAKWESNYGIYFNTFYAAQNYHATHGYLRVSPPPPQSYQVPSAPPFAAPGATSYPPGAMGLPPLVPTAPDNNGWLTNQPHDSTRRVWMGENLGWSQGPRIAAVPPPRGPIHQRPMVEIYSKEYDPPQIHWQHAQTPNPPDYAHRIYSGPQN